ncbi:MAG: hypothetical protein NVS3B20_26670 [Polyangiales bacterium]
MTASEHRAWLGDRDAQRRVTLLSPPANRSIYGFCLLAVMTLSSAIGCGTVRSYRFPIANVSPQTPNQRPQVFFEPETAGNGPVNLAPRPLAPSRPMQELALVESIGTGTKADTESVVSGLMDEASRYGASAVVRVRVDCGWGECHGYGVAVRYLSP